MTMWLSPGSRMARLSALEDRLSILTAERRRLLRFAFALVTVAGFGFLAGLGPRRPVMVRAYSLSVHDAAGILRASIRASDPEDMALAELVGGGADGYASLYTGKERASLALSIPEERGATSVGVDMQGAYLELDRFADRQGEIPPETLNRLFLLASSRSPGDLFSALYLKDELSIAPEGHIGSGHIRGELAINSAGQSALIFRDPSEKPVWSAPAGASTTLHGARN